MFDRPFMVEVNWLIVDTSHSLSNKFATGVKIKATGELKLNNSPTVGHLGLHVFYVQHRTCIVIIKPTIPFQSFLSFSPLGLLVSSLGGVIETNSELTLSISVKMEDTSFFFSLSNQHFKS